MAKKAWNNWFHVVGNTYGTWPRGDPRGWRARHHREHVDGDYKNPPPVGVHDQTFARSKRLMRRERIVLTPDARRVACQEIADTLRFHAVEVIDVGVSAKHYHILARFEPLPGCKYPERVPIPGARNDAPISRIRKPRHLVGVAKKQSAKKLVREGLALAGGVWAARCKVKPVENRAHQLRVARYIPAHAKKGAAVWSLLFKHVRRP
jgi:hypothetical protein